jgi:hypothetical protein
MHFGPAIVVLCARSCGTEVPQDDAGVGELFKLSRHNWLPSPQFLVYPERAWVMVPAVPVLFGSWSFR